MNGASFAPHEVRSSLIRSMSSRAPVVKAFAGREGSSTSSFSQYCFRTWSWTAHGGLGNQDLSCVFVRARGIQSFGRINQDSGVNAHSV